MRITYIHQYFNTPSMTGGTRSYEFGRRLVKMGHEVTVVTSHRESADRRSWYVTEEAGMQVHWLPVPYSNRMGYGARMRAFSAFAIHGARRAASIEADVVFATSTPLTVAIPAIAAKTWQRCPMVFEVRDLWPTLPIAIGALKNPMQIAAARLLERGAYRAARHVVALSPGMKAGVVAAGVPESRVTVIPNASDIEMFANRIEEGRSWRATQPWLRDRPMVLYAGTMGRINGVRYLARVARAAQEIDPEVCFVVVGDGAERNSVEDLGRELGILGRNFFLLDPAPKEAVPAILGAATIATSLVVDLQELWANSANEFFDALASGTPMAINYRGWQAEVLEGEEAGMVLDPHDTDAAACMLVDRARNHAWLASTGANASRVARERFDQFAGELERILRGVARADASPAKA
jgi:glycosyltransferase involved in cell wall biosynthesis